MGEISKLFDERSEQVGAVIILIAAVGYVVDRWAVDFAPDPELFWSIATAGAGIYGAKAIVLLKQVRERLDRDAREGGEHGE